MYIWTKLWHIQGTHTVAGAWTCKDIRVGVLMSNDLGNDVHPVMRLLLSGRWKLEMRNVENPVPINELLSSMRIIQGACYNEFFPFNKNKDAQTCVIVYIYSSTCLHSDD